MANGLRLTNDWHRMTMMQLAKGKPRPVRAAQGLFFLNAVIWLSFGVVSVLRLGDNPEQLVTAVIVAVLMVGNVGAMLLAGFSLGRLTRWSYIFALAVLLVNIVLTFTDQFGIFDLLTLLLDLLLFGLLLATRSLYTGQGL